MDRSGYLNIFSLSVLSILAILGYHIKGLQVAGLHVFPFIIYLVLIQVPATVVNIYRTPSIRLTKYEFILIGILFYAVLSTLWAPDDTLALIGVGVFAPSIAIALAISLSIHTRKEIWALIAVLKGFAVIMIGIGLLSVLTGGQYFGFDWFVDGRFSKGWYANRNDLSYCLSMITPFFLLSAFDRRLSRVRRTAEFVAFLLLLGVIVLNETRAVILSQLIVITVFAIIFAMKQGYMTSTKQIRRPFTAIGLFSVPVFALLFGLISNPFISFPGESLRIRWNLQKGAFLLAYKHPFGVGIGNFAPQFDKLGLYPGGLNPHSWYGEILAELGIGGILTFLYVYGRLLDDILSTAVDRPFSLECAFLVVFSSFAVGALAPDDFLGMQVHWIIFGLTIATIKSSQPPRQTNG